MLARIFSGTTIGLDGVIIEIEVDIANKGFPTFNLVGLIPFYIKKNNFIKIL